MEYMVRFRLRDPGSKYFTSEQFGTVEEAIAWGRKLGVAFKWAVMETREAAEAALAH